MQPTQHLKEVLGEIAVKNTRGPFKDLWELKKGERGGRLPARLEGSAMGMRII